MIIPGTILWLALNIYHESRGEPDLAQVGVAQVTLNRAREDEKTVGSVVREKHQFTWRAKKSKRNAKPWKTDSKVFLACGMNAVKALSREDITGGATHFHSKMRHPPKWTKKMQRTARFGAIIFYKEKS